MAIKYRDPYKEIITPHIAQMLRDLGNSKRTPTSIHEGICHEITLVTYLPIVDVVNVLAPIWENWEHYSGMFSHPIPAVEHESPEIEYFWSTEHWEGEYGRMRKHLALFLADKIEEMIEND